MPSGTLIDYDPAAGRILWHFRTNANVSNGPMAYELDGKQFRVAAAGKTLFAFTLKQADTSSLRLTTQSSQLIAPKRKNRRDRRFLLSNWHRPTGSRHFNCPYTLQPSCHEPRRYELSLAAGANEPRR